MGRGLAGTTVQGDRMSESGQSRMTGGLSDRIRSAFPVACRAWGHDFRLASAEADGDDAIIEEMSCPCGARLVRRLIAYHGVCPECGGEIARRDGLFVCMDCRRTSSEDFSGDFIEVRDRLVMPGNLG